MKKIELIARAVILNKNKIILCRIKGRNWYFLPGGHVEFGEEIEASLKRELMEEAEIKVKLGKVIGVMENFYRENRKSHHEINIIFSGTTANRKISSKEPHIKFEYMDKGQIKNKNILPKKVKTLLTKWLKI